MHYGAYSGAFSDCMTKLAMTARLYAFSVWVDRAFCFVRLETEKTDTIPCQGAHVTRSISLANTLSCLSPCVVSFSFFFFFSLYICAACFRFNKAKPCVVGCSLLTGRTCEDKTPRIRSANNILSTQRNNHDLRDPTERHVTIDICMRSFAHMS